MLIILTMMMMMMMTMTMMLMMMMMMMLHLFCKGSPGQISVRVLLERSHKISTQCLCRRSLDKTSVQALYKSSLAEILGKLKHFTNLN